MDLADLVQSPEKALPKAPAVDSPRCQHISTVALNDAAWATNLQGVTNQSLLCHSLASQIARVLPTITMMTPILYRVVGTVSIIEVSRVHLRSRMMARRAAAWDSMLSVSLNCTRALMRLWFG